MKKLFAVCAAVLAFTLASCTSSSDNKKVQGYYFYVELENESSVIDPSNAPLNQLFNDIKKDVEIWNKSNATYYEVKYETESDLAQCDNSALHNFELFCNAFNSWKEKEYNDKLNNHEEYGSGSFELIYSIHVQKVTGTTTDLTTPYTATFGYSYTVPLE